MLGGRGWGRAEGLTLMEDDAEDSAHGEVMAECISLFFWQYQGAWDLSSLIWDQNHAPGIDSAKSTTGPPGKPWVQSFKLT